MCEDIRSSLSFNFSYDSSVQHFTDDSQHVNSQNSKGEFPSRPVISVARRNERERKRVRLVNQGFAILRDKVPRDRCNRGRRSSKVETLRAAIMYIRQLQQLLMESQTRYQEQDAGHCYTYFGNDGLLNGPGTSPFESYTFNNGFPSDFVQSASYHQLGPNIDIQYSDGMCERPLPMPWFT